MRTYSILLVDDDSLILEMLRIQMDQIAPEHVYIEMASSGEEALRVMRELQLEGEGQVEIIITDYFMPGMTGADFLREAAGINAITHNILLTGQADEQSVNELMMQSALFHVFIKPWSKSALQDVIAQYVLEIDARLNGQQKLGAQ